jgi:hypothetical protein
MNLHWRLKFKFLKSCFAYVLICSVHITNKFLSNFPTIPKKLIHLDFVMSHLNWTCSVIIKTNYSFKSLQYTHYPFPLINISFFFFFSFFSFFSSGDWTELRASYWLGKQFSITAMPPLLLYFVFQIGFLANFAWTVQTKILLPLPLK